MLIDDRNLELVARGFKTIYNENFDATKSHRETLSMKVESQTTEENYGWLGQFPDLREWIGDRHIHQLSSHGFTIRNRKFENTIKVSRDDLADDRYGVYKPMFAELGRVARQHPDRLLFDLLKSGFETNCYDGQYFFDADHPTSPAEMQSASISNMQAGSGPAWFLLDLSKAIKPLIWQEREGYQFQSVDNPSEHSVFMRDEHLYGTRARVNCGFGLWQLAFGSKAALTPEGYASARASMAKFSGDRGQKLGITPTHLIVPSSMEGDALRLINASEIDGSSNIWKGTAELIITPWLE